MTRKAPRVSARRSRIQHRAPLRLHLPPTYPPKEDDAGLHTYNTHLAVLTRYSPPYNNKIFLSSDSQHSPNTRANSPQGNFLNSFSKFSDLQFVPRVLTIFEFHQNHFIPFMSLGFYALRYHIWFCLILSLEVPTILRTGNTRHNILFVCEVGYIHFLLLFFIHFLLPSLPLEVQKFGTDTFQLFTFLKIHFTLFTVKRFLAQHFSKQQQLFWHFPSLNEMISDRFRSFFIKSCKKIPRVTRSKNTKKKVCSHI